MTKTPLNKLRSFREFKRRALKNSEIKSKYDLLEPEYQLIDSIIKKRLQKGISQKQLAKKIGTQQSALSRLESGRYNPSLLTLKKIAIALDSQLSITLK